MSPIEWWVSPPDTSAMWRPETPMQANAPRTYIVRLDNIMAPMAMWNTKNGSNGLRRPPVKCTAASSAPRSREISVTARTRCWPIGRFSPPGRHSTHQKTTLYAPTIPATTRRLGQTWGTPTHGPAAEVAAKDPAAAQRSLRNQLNRSCISLDSWEVSADSISRPLPELPRSLPGAPAEPPASPDTDHAGRTIHRPPCDSCIPRPHPSA